MILMLGPPGAGKSVQGGLLGAALGYVSISTGVLLRERADKSLREKMLKGELINDNIVEDLVINELRAHQPEGALILDGFPRTPVQAAWLLEWASKEGICIECILHISAELEICKRRLLARGRPDDEEAVVESRYADYKEVSGDIIDFMVKADVPIITVDGTQSIEMVHRLVMSQMDHRRKC